MKIKDIIVENIPAQPAKITNVSGNQVTYQMSNGQSSTTDIKNIKPDSNGKLTLQVPQVQPGTAVNVTEVPPSDQSTLSQLGQSTPLQNNQEIQVTEINGSESITTLTDNELIDYAKHNGLSDKVVVNAYGELENRDELVKLLTNGADVGGDQTDDFIQDIEDQEYGQMMERLCTLSGLYSKYKI